MRSTLGRNPKQGSPIHYRRQSDERIVFVPGAPECVEVVRTIYRRRLVEGHGAYRIAKSLNDRGALSPTGVLWSTDTVENIVSNPTYTGVGIAGRYATGVYHLQSTDARPKELSRTLTDVAMRTSRSPKLRTKDQWRWQPHPLLVDYLGDDLRERAVTYQARAFEKQHRRASAPKAKKGKPGGDRNVDSNYILKGILRTKQGAHAMTGKTTGRVNNKGRYYRVSRGTSTPTSEASFARMVPADALECAVLDAIGQVLLDGDGVREAVRVAVESRRDATKADGEDLAPMLAQQAELTARLTDALMMNEAARRLMAEKISQWQARAADLERRIDAARAAVSESSPADAHAIATAVAGELKTLGLSLATMPPYLVREVLASLVGRLDVDLETGAVEMELLLPEGATHGNTVKVGGVCPVGDMPRHRPNGAHRLERLKLASVTCEGTRGGRRTPACYTCSRRLAA